MTEKVPMTLGGIIDALANIRDVRRELDKQSNDLKKEYEDLEIQLINKLDAEEMIQGKGKTATATINKSIVPNIRDWDAFEAYILENDALFMLEKRPSVTAFRDVLSTGDLVPGLEAFEKTRINLRSL